jgi:hypothetical protein
VLAIKEWSIDISKSTGSHLRRTVSSFLSFWPHHTAFLFLVHTLIFIWELCTNNSIEDTLPVIKFLGGSNVTWYLNFIQKFSIRSSNSGTWMLEKCFSRKCILFSNINKIACGRLSNIWRRETLIIFCSYIQYCLCVLISPRCYDKLWHFGLIYMHNNVFKCIKYNGTFRTWKKLYMFPFSLNPEGKRSLRRRNCRWWWCEF